jgi:pantothenate kinase
MNIFTNKKLTIIYILLLLFSFACGTSPVSKMSAVDKAGVTAQEISKTYVDLYNTAKYYTENGTPEEQEFMKKQVNAKLNKAKEAIVAMDEAVALWKQTGVDTMNAQQKQTDLNALLADISKMLISKK